MTKKHRQPSDDQVEHQSAETEAAPEPLHAPDPDDNSAAPGGDQDIDTAGTDADDHPLTRPKAATARSRRSSTDSERA